MELNSLTLLESIIVAPENTRELMILFSGKTIDEGKKIYINAEEIEGSIADAIRKVFDMRLRFQEGNKFYNVVPVTAIETNGFDLKVQLNKPGEAVVKLFAEMMKDKNTPVYMRFTSVFALRLSRALEDHGNGVGFTTDGLKYVLGIPKDAYYTPAGLFNRAVFEKFALKGTLEEINEKSPTMKNISFHKTYAGQKVDKYVFTFEKR
jgi:plasmid replication initiation protein